MRAIEMFLIPGLNSNVITVDRQARWTKATEVLVLSMGIILE